MNDVIGMGHIDEETAAGVALRLLPAAGQEQAAAHIRDCARCREMVETYRAISGAMSAWQEAPPEAVEAGTRSVIQRLRLHRLLTSALADPSVRRQAAQNPEGLLAAYGVTPSPQLLAAFKELEVMALDQFGGALDERVSKLFQLLD